MQILERRHGAAVGAIAILGLGLTPGAWSAETPSDKIPITTSSEEARRLYLQGRDLFEKLRGTDARKFFEQAVALAPKASDGERRLILGFDAGVKGNELGVNYAYVRSKAKEMLAKS